MGADPGADKAAVKTQISRLLDRSYPEAEVLTNQEFKDDIAGQVNQLLGLIYALLALAIIVSLFGIVNTLVLSISERTRELGMLRAIGTSRKQVKRVIRWEAVITALIGGVLGVFMGVVLAMLFTQPLDDFTLSIPVPSLIIVLILAGAGRRGRGGPPGAAGGQARRPRGARLRVTKRGGRGTAAPAASFLVSQGWRIVLTAVTVKLLSTSTSSSVPSDLRRCAS